MSRKLKDSGIEWIGEIPEGWEVKPIFVYFKERKCKNVGNVEKNLLSLSYGNIVRKDASNNMGLLPESFENYNIIESGNIVFRLTDLQNDHVSLRSGLVKERGIITSAYVTLESNITLYSSFFNYLFRSYDNCKVFYNMGGGVRQGINFNELKKLLITIPRFLEQQAITDYLEKKCSLIDSAIEKQKKVIEKLKLYKQSIITEAVTKGIDHNVKKKDSGIEWIGEIPGHWKIMKLKYVIKTVESGTSVNAAYYPASGDEIGVLKTSCVYNNVFNPNENKCVELYDLERVTCPLRKDTIIVSRMNAPDLVGACGYVDQSYENIFLPDRLWQIDFLSKINPKFTWYFLSSSGVKWLISMIATGTSSSMKNISQDQFRSIFIPIPPKEEQIRIIDELEKKCLEIEKLISYKLKLIEKLTNYKKSLIYECVTGKREVI